MKSKSAMLLAATVIAVAAQAMFSGPASAACKPGYKSVKYQNSGNKVCVLDAAAGGDKLKAR